jgi:hypothetical protein
MAAAEDHSALPPKAGWLIGCAVPADDVGGAHAVEGGLDAAAVLACGCCPSAPATSSGENSLANMDAGALAAPGSPGTPPNGGGLERADGNVGMRDNEAASHRTCDIRVNVSSHFTSLDAVLACAAATWEATASDAFAFIILTFTVMLPHAFPITYAARFAFVMPYL